MALMAYSRSWRPPPNQKMDEGANKFFICLDYDPFEGVTEKMFLVMTTETRQRGDWYAGRVIPINGKEYVLGPERLDKTRSVSNFELVSRDAPALSLDDD